MKETAKDQKLKLSTKLGFGVGDIYGGGAMLIIGIYYLHYLTDVMLISPALAGVAFFVSKIWDAVTDPMMGYISDRTRTRFGRRRPYFLFGIVLIFISFFLMWYPVDFDLEKHRFIYILIAYIFFSTVITMVMIPYNALAAELTLDYNERTSLTTYRIIFSGISSLICAVLPFEIVKFFPDNERSGYIVMAVAFGLFFAIPFIATFLTTREREEFQKEPTPFNFRRSYVEPFFAPTFLNVLLMYLFSFVAIDAVMSIVIYFMKYYMMRLGETDYVLGTILVLQVLVIPIYSWVSKKTSKKTSFIISALIWLVVMGFSYFITPELPKEAIYVFGGLVGLGTGGIVIMIYSIFTDVPDVDELYTGERREGIYSGLFMFARKMSSAVGIFLISQIIDRTGYIKPVEGIVDGKEVLIEQAQTPEFIMVLKLIFALIPVLFLALSAYNAFRYKLTPSLHARIKEHLNKRREGDEMSGEMQEEELELKRLLERR
ncbi:MAG: MFS transporter [Deltaproteobacteria bacterium]|uniref:MFS transporter n=1 Tax=Candidatus Zymogenus saltonus TaxID=2844893 RepID=A0A9D8PM36_9DELT|nr:MFS transporter [Candidatus Zymogenus saltonus]